MPFVELNTLPVKEVIEGYTAKAIHTGEMSFVYWSVKAGASMPLHQHVHVQVAHVLTGRFELVVDGVNKVLEPGIVAVIPSNHWHGGRALTDCTLLDVFQPVREDYKF
jgi:quercetin dioxygenase-like cupin family protein